MLVQYLINHIKIQLLFIIKKNNKLFSYQEKQIFIITIIYNLHFFKN